MSARSPAGTTRKRSLRAGTNATLGESSSRPGSAARAAIQALDLRVQERFAHLEARNEELQQDGERMDLQLRQHAEAIGQQNEQPRWMATVGAWLMRIAYVFFFVQNCPWWLVMCWAPRPTTSTGWYNPRAAVFTMMIWAGGALNALAIVMYVHFVKGQTELVAFSGAYAMWFVAVAVLNAGNLRARVKAGRAHVVADQAFDAQLFKAFGVIVGKVTDSEVALPLYYLVSLVPAMVFGFVVRWITFPRYEVVCSALWTNTTAGVSSCLTEQNGLQKCCRPSDQRDDYFTFVGFLAGNLVAACTTVKYGALCLFAAARARDGVEGGASGFRRISTKMAALPRLKSWIPNHEPKAKRESIAFELKAATLAAQPGVEGANEAGLGLEVAESELDMAPPVLNPASGDTGWTDSVSFCRSSSASTPAASSHGSGAEDDVWEEVLCPDSGQTYYHNRERSESTWEKPVGASIRKLGQGDEAQRMHVQNGEEKVDEDLGASVLASQTF